MESSPKPGSRWGRLPSPALVIAVLALLVSLGGTASATGLLGPCGYLVCAGDIGTGAVDSRVVKNGSLATLDLSNATIAQLRSEPDFKKITFASATATIPGQTLAQLVTAECPAGYVAIGGGGTSTPAPPVPTPAALVLAAYPSDAHGASGTTAWSAVFFNPQTAAATARVDVTCAPAGA